METDVLPNRMPDCSGHIGVAREIATILGSRSRAPIYKFREDREKKINDVLKLKVKDKKLCPRYCAKVITGIKVKRSPKWLEKRLVACGIEPINNIVDSTNYVMLETGQPLHAFDLDKISNSEIIVRKAKEKEKITALDGKTYYLKKDYLVIADQKEPIAIAGVKGGKRASITASTKTIVLEAANFDRLSVYRASKKLKIQSDAALRFSSGLDPNLPEEAMEGICNLIQEIVPGKVLKGIIDFYPKKNLPKKIKLDLNYVKDLVGIEIPKRKIIKIFKNLGFSFIYRSSTKSSGLMVKVPTFRQDISIPEDLIEEIVRISGYQRIRGKLPVLPIMIPKKNEEVLWERRIKEILKGLGFTETYNYSFISDKDEHFFRGINKNLQLIEIKNPTSSNTKYLRSSLVPNLLKVIGQNQARFRKINIFEIGHTFYWQKLKSKKQQVLEKKMLSGLISGKDKFFELKGKIEAFLKDIGIANILLVSYKSISKAITKNFWQVQNSAKMKVNHTEVGFLGKISRKVSNFYQIEEPIFAFEINLEEMLKLVIEEHEYKAPSQYPEMIRDVAVLVPTATLAGEVMEKIHIGGGSLVRDVEIFDVFEGPSLPKGEKSLAFRVVYQAKDRTLTSKEVEKIQAKIINLLERNSSWEVRK